ncbi:MAG: hypothetical protein PHY48_08800 [Candidatus Cloacimonetes bacterium]|nr:hypothetical protein [Candidatus Cloacimonadota bacterium]
MKNQDKKEEKPDVKIEDTKLSFKFSFSKPNDMDRELNEAIIAFAKEHHLSASQSTCCGASKGKNRNGN